MTKFPTFVHGSVRHLALALTLAGIPASVLAVDDTLVVTYKDNHTFSYVLSDQPTVTFDATQMFIKSTDHRCGGMKSEITGGSVPLYT